MLQDGWSILPPELQQLLKAHQAELTALSIDSLCQDDRKILSTTSDTAANQLVRRRCFFACKGERYDGREATLKLVLNAHVSTDVVMLLIEADNLTNDVSRQAKGIYTVPNLSQWLGHIASRFYGEPSRRLKLIGVTGTNGKTTTTWFIAQLAAKLGLKVGIMGTIGYGSIAHLQSQPMTTVDPIALQARLADFVADGLEIAAIEVSSHGLVQGRLNGCVFWAAVLTNLTRDHLDYHGTMADYREAKQRLFMMPELEHAIVNSDQLELGQQFLDNTSAATRWCYSTKAQFNQQDAFENIQSLQLQQDPAGATFLEFNEQREPWMHTLIGDFNDQNVLAACAALASLQIPLAKLSQAITQLSPPPGRMERIELPNAALPLVIVDYAHTPDAVAQVLHTLAKHRVNSVQQLIVVFGCGGNRDAGKRALMGHVVATIANVALVTADNPRDESAKSICDEIVAGMTLCSDEGVRIIVETDRRRAITQAIAIGKQGDCIAILGKGHENYQEIAGQRLPFDDRVVAKQALLNYIQLVK